MTTNPTMTKKEEKPLIITDNTKRIFQVIYKEKQGETINDSTPKLKVSTLISKMAFYYEKIRNSVDYKEEHLLRKNAILRILKRQIMIEGVIQNVKSEDVAKHLLIELIRAGYLPNDKIPETKIEESSTIISRFIVMKEAALSSLSITDFKQKNEISKWILAMAACEIEESLGRSLINQIIIADIYSILSSAIQLPPNSPYESEKEIQIYVSIYRNFLKFDSDMIGFILFKYYNKNWNEVDLDTVKKIGNNLGQLRQKIEAGINHPLAGQLNRIVLRYTVYFSILKDVIENDPVGVYNNFYSDPKAFPRDIKNACKKRYTQAKSKLWRAGIRSIIYIFLTKSIFAVALEIPASKFFGQEINDMAMLINVTFPAILLFFIIMFTKLPSEKNTTKIIEGINSIVFKNYNEHDKIILREPPQRMGALNTFFGVLYACAFLFSIWIVISILHKIGFNFISIIIFLFFLAFVSFFAIRIRKGAHEMLIVDENESFFRFLVDFFYIPIVAVGKWLSEKFSRINVFVFILDFIIEAPFKIFVEIAEEWTKYVKERRDRIV